MTYRIRTLGKDAILDEMRKGATIYRVSGRFGGWDINGASDIVTVRQDSCRKLVESGLVKVIRRDRGYVEYGLR